MAVAELGFETFSSSNAVLLCILIGGSSLLWTFYGFVYRLFLSPVAKVPGPKLAALSFWYEFYYDVIKKGQYTFKLKELHKKYGPIIRINPYEVHINDPEFYDQVYVGSVTRKTDKWWWSADMFSIPGALLSTQSHELHRKRRAMVSSHFSIASIRRLEPVIRSKVDKFVSRMDQAAQSDEPICLTHAFSALTIDVITAYTFGDTKNYLDAPDFSPQFAQLSARTGVTSHTTKQMPWLVNTARSIPQWLSVRMFPAQQIIIKRREGFREQVLKAKERKRLISQSGHKKIDEAEVTGNVHSIFDTMLDAKVPESEKDTGRLIFEAQTLIIAGTLTTAHALETITYHLLMNVQLRIRLRQELAEFRTKWLTANPTIEAVEPKDLPLTALESCDYLAAVIREGLRMSYGVPHRLQRVSPDTSLHYGDYELPPGTPVSMSAMMMHEDETIFPDPFSFKPERWLPLDTVGNTLYKYLVPFSKGSRQCVGMNLAWAELYFTVPAVFGRNLEYELYDTDFERDIKIVIDGFNPLPSPSSRGLRVTVNDPSVKV